MEKTEKVVEVVEKLQQTDPTQSGGGNMTTHMPFLVLDNEQADAIMKDYLDLAKQNNLLELAYIMHVHEKEYKRQKDLKNIPIYYPTRFYITYLNNKGPNIAKYKVKYTQTQKDLKPIQTAGGNLKYVFDHNKQIGILTQYERDNHAKKRVHFSNFQSIITSINKFHSTATNQLTTHINPLKLPHILSLFKLIFDKSSIVYDKPETELIGLLQPNKYYINYVDLSLAEDIPAVGIDMQICNNININKTYTVKCKFIFKDGNNIKSVDFSITYYLINNTFKYFYNNKKYDILNELLDIVKSEFKISNYENQCISIAPSISKEFLDEEILKKPKEEDEPNKDVDEVEVEEFPEEKVEEEPLKKKRR